MASIAVYAEPQGLHAFKMKFGDLSITICGDRVAHKVLLL